MNFNDFPDIEIHLKKRLDYKSKKLVNDKIILKPEDYIVNGKKIKNDLNLRDDKDFSDLFETTKEECQSAFMPIDVPAPRGPIFVFGEYFMKKFYTVFDRDEMVLGFSLANHNTNVDRSLNFATPYDDGGVLEYDDEKEIIKENKPVPENKNGAINLNPEDPSEFFKAYIDEINKNVNPLNEDDLENLNFDFDS
jgi:hypothetical protein